MFIDGATFRRLVRARELLADTALPVRAIAAQVVLSPSYFIRAFAALFGDTPHQFRTRVRVDRAKALLAGGRSVTETCFELGFSSLPSFSGLFTRWVGAPPTRYRTSLAVPGLRILVPGCLGMLAQLPFGALGNCR
ncbi:MAG TPA: AraC family transcriptional regulator [Kofleriaceae bacterium]|jgi:AraC-like DNA-binding protein|nr:AraC family transcriptional regulator [Kofleriaceae bacterium]